MEGFRKLPSSAVSVDTWTAKTAQGELDDLRKLVELSKVAKPVYENMQEDNRYGVTRKWLSEAKDYWLNEFSWYVPQMQSRRSCCHEFTAMFLHSCLPLAYEYASPGKNAKTVSTHFRTSRPLLSMTALFSRSISWLCFPKSQMLSP